MVIALDNTELLDEFTKLEYSLSLVETELYSNLFNIYEDTINESISLTYIEESIKETIIRYLNKIIQSLQKSWESFLAGLAEGLGKNTVTKLKNLNPSDDELRKIVISNFPVYDDMRINNIKVLKFDYEPMKQFLKDDKTYIGKYYPNIAPKDNEKLKDTMFKYCVKERKEDFRLTKADLNNIISSMENYRSELDTISKDLETINGSSKAIEQIVNNSTENTTPADLNPTNDQNETTEESFYISDINAGITLLESFFITEADSKVTPAGTQTTTVGANVSTKVEPAKGAGAGTAVKNPNEKEKVDTSVKITQDRVTKADKNSQIVKDVRTYMSASTKVLVAKMRLLRIRFSNYTKIAKAIINSVEKKKTPTNKQNNEEDNEGSRVNQVEI